MIAATLKLSGGICFMSKRFTHGKKTGSMITAAVSMLQLCKCCSSLYPIGAPNRSSRKQQEPIQTVQLGRLMQGNVSQDQLHKQTQSAELERLLGSGSGSCMQLPFDISVNRSCKEAIPAVADLHP